MLLHIITSFLLTNLWPFVLSTLLGLVLGFYLALGLGKQAGYVGRIILHPARLAHGEWLCPQCNGSKRYGEHTCYFCLPDMMAGIDQGWVSRKHLFGDWDWKSWTLKLVFSSPGVHGQ